MSITVRNPNTVLLAGGGPLINDIPASAAITPGMLVELHSNSGSLAWRKNASATEIQAMFVALNQDEMNLGVDAAYAAGDLVKAKALPVGSVFWAIIPSGQNIAIAGLLQSNGDGKLKAATATTQAAGLGRFQALEASGAVVADTRLRVQVIQ